MKIAVIDDERPARKELIHQILAVMPDSQIDEADSGSSAIDLISRKEFDLLFIDINLDDMEGTALASAAKKLLPHAQIVFATAYSQYAVKAFELEVNNYILKPFDPLRVQMVLEKCQRELKTTGSEQSVPVSPPSSSTVSGRLPVNMNKTIVLLDIGKIVYIETSGRSCIIHTTEQDYTENLLLGEYEKRLSPHGFLRIHKSFLVNLKYITEMFPWANNSLALKMQGFEQNILPISRERLKLLRQLIGM
ncbi:MAG: LytR/AlgR family response regulator transcription factor [Lachnospiraceae bacterium]